MQFIIRISEHKPKYLQNIFMMRKKMKYLTHIIQVLYKIHKAWLAYYQEHSQKILTNYFLQLL